MSKPPWIVCQQRWFAICALELSAGSKVDPRCVLAPEIAVHRAQNWCGRRAVRAREHRGRKGEAVMLQSVNGVDQQPEIDKRRSERYARPDLPEWEALDRRLRAYGQHRATLDAAEMFDLARAEQLKIYFEFGHVNIYEYMERVLGYGPHAARERMRVARSLAKLPETTSALARGELRYSAVREPTRVATDETEGEWLAATRGLVVNQIERLVAGHQAGDRPADPTHPDLRPRVVRIELPPEVYALWRQARMVVAEERGTEISDADFVETICRTVIAPGSGASSPAHQIAYQQCPDCRRVTQHGAGREIDSAPEVVDRASCDARHLGSLDAPVPERATTTVTPRVREQVFARDHHRCTAPGCRSARNLEVHHIVEQARGGTHELSNLCLLCSGHHAALHAGLLTIRGRAPYELELRWAYGPPIPVGLTSVEREALIDQRVSELLAQIVPNGESEHDHELIRPTPDTDQVRRHRVPRGTFQVNAGPDHAGMDRARGQPARGSP